MLQIENIEKSFGAQTLFENIQFRINKGERVGLVGRNGHGKTTLFKIIMGAEAPDSGNVVVPKGYRIGHVSQHLEFTKDTIIEEAILGLPEHRDDQSWKAEKILSGLGFTENDMQRSPYEFSGGYQVRLNLSKILVAEPDLLLLDEPTNYLDITSIRWVTRFLKDWPNELMLITHDRGFMDNVVTHVIGIHRKTCKKIQGNTEKFYTQIAQEEEIHEKTRINDEKRRKEINQFITRFRAKARLANLVQSRIKMVERMGKREKLDNIQTLDFSFRNKPFNGKYVTILEHVSFGYDSGPALIEDLNCTVFPGDRICIVGKNGKGKTTLIKLLGGRLPCNRGRINMHQNVCSGFYEQTNVESLVPTRTVEEEILYTSEDVDRQKARNICGAMMFEGDSALKRISVLSGGEKSRVMLGKILAEPVNLLLLDEPTNHLDMESCDALLTAIDHFDGAVVMATHNEMFLHAVAERLLVFDDEGISVFEGSYRDFLDKGGWEDDSENPGDGEKSGSRPETKPKRDRKELKRLRSELIGERSKIIKPIERKIEQTESDIEKFENLLEQLNTEMQRAAEQKDGSKITEISQSIHQYQAQIDELFEHLEGFISSLETKTAHFEDRLKALELEAEVD